MSEKTIKIEHKEANNFSSHLATGAVVVGPTPDGLYHITFYADAIKIESETAIEIQGTDVYQPGLKGGDLKQYREDKARISMQKDMIERLVTAISSQISTEDTDK